MIGTVVNNQTSKNRDSEENQRLLSCEIEADSVQTVELSNVSGEDNNPLNGDTVLIINVSDAYKLGILIDDGVAPDGSINKGEKLLYSRDSSGAVKAKVALKNNGEIILNDGGDFAVKFNELKAAFDQLKADFNAHVHPTGSPNTGTPTVPSTANMDSSKVEKVRL